MGLGSVRATRDNRWIVSWAIRLQKGTSQKATRILTRGVPGEIWALKSKILEVSCLILSLSMYPTTCHMIFYFSTCAFFGKFSLIWKVLPGISQKTLLFKKKTPLGLEQG